MIRTLATATLALLCFATPASAQNYPSRPIKFVVPFAAGSATDTLARVLGDHVSRTLRGNVVVENMAGGSGVIAAQAVARAAADGYTVLIATNTTHAANQSLLKQMPYDAVNDFEPVTKLGTIVLALAIHPSVPAKNVRDLVTYAKANPGKLSFGAGSASSRLAGEMLKSLAGIDVVYVAYRSNPQVITDILGGHIQMVFADLSTTMPQIKEGKLVGLGVSSKQRTALAPDLPSMVEAGVAGYELTAWFAAFAPAKTPKPVVDQLQAALHAALADRAATDRMLAAGIEAEKSSSEELKAFVVSETKKWADLVKAAGIQPE